MVSSMYDLSDTAEAIEALIETAVPGLPVYWTAGKVPAVPPDKFAVIEPLFLTVNQSWGVNTHSRHSVQVRACATTIGDATGLAASILAALPATQYEVATAGPPVKVGDHYDMLLTPRTHATGA